MKPPGTLAGLLDSTDQEVRAWRRRMRHELRLRRVRLAGEQRERCTAEICDTLADQFTMLWSATIGFYWPIRGEVDLVGFVTDLVEGGARAALPVVVAKKRPVELHSWSPGMPMSLRLISCWCHCWDSI